MGRVSRYYREERNVTKEWIEYFCKPRITTRDKEIFKFIYTHRIVTSEQIAKVFWFDSSQAQVLANRRLRILYDLHCIDRFFPVTQKGSSLQHVVLDYAGARILELKSFKKIQSLPIIYRHTVLVTDFIILARKKGFGSAKREENLKVVTPDIYYPDRRIAVEIDLGTETHKILKNKVERYRRLKGLKWLIFVTTGNPERGKHFKNVNSRYAYAHWRDISELLTLISKQLR